MCDYFFSTRSELVKNDTQRKTKNINCLIKVLLTITTIHKFPNNSQKQKCIKDGTALLNWPPTPDARLTASGRSSGRAHVNWHLTSSLSGSVAEPNSAYQAVSLMWGEWCKARWGCVKPEAEHQSTGQRSDQYWLSHRQMRLGWWASERRPFLIDLGRTFTYTRLFITVMVVIVAIPPSSCIYLIFFSVTD